MSEYAPDTTGGELRDAIAEILPALRDLLAERDTLAAQVQAVEGLAEELDIHVSTRGKPATGSYDDGVNRAQANAADRIRRALGTPTTGGGE